MNNALILMRLFSFLVFCTLFVTTVTAQDIPIINKSFEGQRAIGNRLKPFYLEGWGDCGAYIFPRESPPDVHPIEQWGNLEDPLHGSTFVGLVIRENNSWESIAQKLVAPMDDSHCYEFSIAIKASDNYLSGSSYRQVHFNDTSRVQFTQPTVLRVWGSHSACAQEELLGESPAVQKQDWHKYTFTFKPSQKYTYIMLEAFYKVPVPNMRLYNGHIMIDDASDLKVIPCPQDPDLFASVEPISQETVDIAVVEKPKKKVPVHVQKTKRPEDSAITKTKEPKKRKKYDILTELNDNTVKAGQVIEVKKLFFIADDYKVTPQSTEVLDELYVFLEENPSIRLEVGGHTNSQPSDDYCHKLSKMRANEVANHLIKRGISKNRIETKGYGKSKPIASNKTIVGRKRNQRVEIKILSV